jgi:hypothetical protein
MKQLLVEGKTDKYLIEEICRDTKLSLQDITFQIPGSKQDDGGISQLLKGLPIIIKNANQLGDVVGVVIDADLNAAGRWQHIRQLLTDVGYSIQLTDVSQGLVVESHTVLPRFGLWMMPNNQDEGILENFIRQLIHEKDILQPEVEQILDGLRAKELQLFPDVKRPKAFIKTWLAWQEDPEISFGVAIKKKVLMTDAALCQQFTTWLKRLFLA